MRVVLRIREERADGALGEFAAPLVGLEHDLYDGAGLDIASLFARADCIGDHDCGVVLN